MTFRLTEEMKRKPERLPPELLREMARTFIARNKTYGTNYRNVGPVLQGLFPNGVRLATADEFTAWHLLELIVVKLTRFANSGLKHRDSIHDTGVYAAMIEGLIIEKERNETRIDHRFRFRVGRSARKKATR